MGSQHNPITIAGVLLSQIINWIVIIGAAIVYKNIYNKSIWPIIIIISIILSKSASVLFGKPPIIEFIYSCFLFTLFLAMGIIYIQRYLYLFYKLVMIICLINTIMMFFQIIDAGEWTHVLYSQEAEIITYDILFVPLSNYQYSMFQARPTGFLRASGILSGVVLFAMALHFSRYKRRLWWGTLVLCTMTVLSSARIVYIGYLVMVLLLLIRGDRIQRVSAIYSLITLSLLLLLYSFLFPGLFQDFWTIGTFFSSFYIRINDIITVLGVENSIRIYLENYLIDSPRVTEEYIGGFTSSGYKQILMYLPYFIISVILIIPHYLKGFKKQRNLFPHLKWVTTLCLIVFILYPAAIPIFRSQFYWLVAGFSLSPLFILLPSYVPRKVVQSK